MNRHRAYWSIMGVEPSNHKQETRENLEKELDRLANIYGLDEIITVFRKMKLDEIRDNNVRKIKVK